MIKKKVAFFGGRAFSKLLEPTEKDLIKSDLTEDYNAKFLILTKQTLARGNANIKYSNVLKKRNQRAW